MTYSAGTSPPAPPCPLKIKPPLDKHPSRLPYLRLNEPHILIRSRQRAPARLHLLRSCLHPLPSLASLLKPAAPGPSPLLPPSVQGWSSIQAPLHHSSQSQMLPAPQILLSNPNTFLPPSRQASWQIVPLTSSQPSALLRHLQLAQLLLGQICQPTLQRLLQPSLQQDKSLVRLQAAMLLSGTLQLCLCWFPDEPGPWSAPAETPKSPPCRMSAVRASSVQPPPRCCIRLSQIGCNACK